MSWRKSALESDKIPSDYGWTKNEMYENILFIVWNEECIHFSLQPSSQKSATVTTESGFVYNVYQILLFVFDWLIADTWLLVFVWVTCFIFL